MQRLCRGVARIAWRAEGGGEVEVGGNRVVVCAARARARRAEEGPVQGARGNSRGGPRGGPRGWGGIIVASCRRSDTMWLTLAHAGSQLIRLGGAKT